MQNTFERLVCEHDYLISMKVGVEFPRSILKAKVVCSIF